MASPHMAVVLALFICVWHIQHAAAGSSAASVERSATLVHGNVKTTRTLATAMRGRKLSEGANASKEQVWLVGFPSDLQAHVHLTMKGMACQVLHPLPGTDDHHWIISASQRMVIKLLNAHPELTAALLPNDMKMSPELKDALADDAMMQDGERIKLDALLPHTSHAHLQQAMIETRKHLVKMLENTQPNKRCHPQLQAAMHGFVLSVCGKDVAAAATWLVSQPGVTWVDIHHDKQLLNLHASAAIQSPGSLQVSQPGDSEATIRQGVSGGLFPLWAAGLDGTGQTAGVVDSGFDTDSCFFYDPAIPNPISNSHLVNLSRYAMDHLVLPEDENDHHAELQKDTHINVYQNTTHRKVVQLVQYADSDPDAHGTHVGGTVAGAAYNTISTDKPLLATGVAPGAKLAFYDVGPAGTRAVITPLFPDLLYGIQHEVGARVSCNSWGGATFSYNPQSYRYDAYAWQEQSMLLVFAAGNEGRKLYNYDTGTINTPANSKNVLSVGAGENWVQSDVYESGNNGKEATFLSGPAEATVPTTGWNFLDTALGGPYVQLLSQQPGGNRTLTLITNDNLSAPPLYYYMLTNLQKDTGVDPSQPLQGVSFLQQSDLTGLTQGTDYPIVFGGPHDGCQTIARDAEPRTKIYLISKSPGSCDVQTSVSNAFNAGAAGVMIFYPNVGGDVIGSGADFYQSSKAIFPAVTIPAGLGELIANDIAKGYPVSIRIDPPSGDTIPIENVAIFSGWGSNLNYSDKPAQPANNAFTDLDVRIKPDVIAPGWILSAWTDNIISGTMDQCGAVYSQGTSMAAPVVTGAAAIVRQYFEDGYYPTGDRSTGEPRDPSAPLVKATLIAGTAAMTGIHRATGYKLDPPPSPFQGFGRVDLSSSLPIAGSGKGWSMQVVDMVNMTASGDTHTYTLTAAASTPAKPLIVTLVWNDYPAFPGNAYILVNHLDLSITDPNGMVHWGNNRDDGDLQNNVEKVYIAEPTAGDYTITVKARNIFADGGPQPYALVALGGFTGTLDPPAA